MKSEFTIFYSWQSDIEAGKKFIGKALDKAIKNVKNKKAFKSKITINVDRSLKKRSGTVDVANDILDKISKADIFIGDITIVNREERPSPNPNVMLELGYAVGILDWKRILCICNEEFGTVETLPFDLRHRSILLYEENIDASLEILVSQLEIKLSQIISDYDNIILQSRRKKAERHDEQVFQTLGDLHGLMQSCESSASWMCYTQEDYFRWTELREYYLNAFNHFLIPELHETFSKFIEELGAFAILMASRLTRVELRESVRKFKEKYLIPHDVMREFASDIYHFFDKNIGSSEDPTIVDRLIREAQIQIDKQADELQEAYKNFIKAYKEQIVINK